MNLKVTNHAKERMKQRNISPQTMRVVVCQGARQKMKGGLAKANMDGIEVVLDARTKTILTVYSTQSQPKSKKKTKESVCRFCKRDFQRHDLMLRHIERKHFDLIHY